MKTTVELPAELVREVKLLAVSAGHELEDEIAALRRAGLQGRRTARPGCQAACRSSAAGKQRLPMKN